MSRLVRGSAVVLLLALPLTVHAWGWRRHEARANTYYYPSAPVYVYGAVPYAAGPVYVTQPQFCTAVVQPAPAPILYAQPRPAPASSGPVAPPASRPSPEPPPAAPPAVTETHSFFDAYAVAPRSTDQAPGDRCQISFWNLSGREMTVKVNGRPQVLASGQKVSLDLERRFIWNVEGREPQKEDIARSESAMAIVIRR